MPSDLTAVGRVLDALSGPVVLLSSDGTVAGANAAFRSEFGWAPTDLTGLSFADFLATPKADWLEYFRRCASTSGPLAGSLSVTHADGRRSARRSHAAAFRPFDEPGDPFVLLTLEPDDADASRLVDLTRQVDDLSVEVARRRRAEAAAASALEGEQRVRERIVALSDASSALVASLSPHDVLPEVGRLAEQLIAADAYAVWQSDPVTGAWRIVWQQRLSDAFVASLAEEGWPGAAAAALHEPIFVEDVDAVPLLADRRPTYRREGIQSLAVIPLRVAGVSCGTVVAYYRRRMSMGVDDRRIAMALGNFASSVLTMASLYQAESRSRVAAQTAERRADFLAKASATLGSSLDYEATLKTVAWLAVPEIADWCAVDVAADNGEVTRVAVAHVDEAKLEMVRALQEKYPDDPDAPYGAAEIMRTARPFLVSAISDELIAANARDPEHLRLIRALGLTSYMCVPLTVRGRALGVLTFAAAESGRTYTESDLRFAEEVASRAALAVENARIYAEVREANRLKDDFLATLSHELRTPLNAVLGYTRMMRTRAVTAAKREHALAVVERNAAALNHIIEDVLDVSRITTGKLRLNIRPVDLSIVLRDAAATVLPAAEAKGVRLQTVVEPDAPLVAGDADRLQQVVWNLLSNAVKFTPRSGRVELRLERTDAHLAIVVSDTGVGIRPGFLPFVFERFRQADSRLTREHGGLGLGLAIAQHLVEMHGGTIDAASDGDGRGATFTVRLPAMSGHRDLASAVPAAGNILATNAFVRASAELQGVRVLAVDGDPDALAVMSEILHSAGATVAIARSAFEAIEQLEGLVPPDILLTDVAMPGMDGFELMAYVRQCPRPDVRDVPAVALTAYARSSDRTRALESGYQIHLVKPVAAVELIAAVKTLASRDRASERQL